MVELKSRKEEDNELTVGERVKTIRKEYGLTMDRFGKRLGITKAGISRIESGVTNLTPQMAKSIAREFGISEEWLKTGEGEMRPATASGAAAEIAGRLGLGPWATQALERFMDLKENEQILFLDILEKILDPSESPAPLPAGRIGPPVGLTCQFPAENAH